MKIYSLYSLYELDYPEKIKFIDNLTNDIQVVRQTQSNVNFGTQTGASRTATNNRVN